MKKSLLLFGVFLLLIYSANAQTREISGTVTSVEGDKTLPGVNVVVKGTSVGTVTDVEGQYRINAPADGGTLVFSFIGLETKEIVIGNQSIIDVKLSNDVTQLSEVVVTALGVTRSKKSVGYAVQEVDGETLAETREPNFINSLQGEVAGVQIQGTGSSMGSSSRITIRGVNSFLGNNQPLFVIDGVPISNANYASGSQQRGFGTGTGQYDYGNAAAQVNPADIESVNVLKGAAATALYGVRGSNGVIVITTKNGKGKQGIGVSVNSAVTMDDPLALIPHQQVYGGGAIVTGTESGFTEFTQDGVDYLAPVYAKDGSWGPKYDPNVQVRHWDSWDPQSPNYKETRPWVAPENGYEEFFETGITWTNNVALEGSNDMGAFRLSYTNLDQQGIMPNSNLGRNTVSLSGTYNLSSRLTASAVANYVSEQANGRNMTGYNNGNPMQGFTQWWQTNLDMKRLQDNIFMTDGQQYVWNHRGISTDEEGNLIDFNQNPQFFDNPYFVREQFLQEDERDRIFGNFNLTYELTDHLTLSGKAMLDEYTFKAYEGIPKESVDQSRYGEVTRTFRETNFDARLSYYQEFQDFSVNAIVGGNRMYQERTYTNVSTVGGLSLDGFYHLSNSVQPIDYDLSNQNFREEAINSLYAITSFGWNEILFLDASLRMDYASTLPEEENPFLYPSVSSSFVFSELPMFKSSNVVSFGKLRAGYGEAANAPSPYSLQNTFAPITPNFGAASRFSLPDARNNPNLRPEFTKEWEVGLEMNFLQNRIGFDFVYYNRITTDQIFPVDVSPATGFTSRFINAGTMKNSGIELMLNATPVVLGDFRWDISANFATYNNEVVELVDGTQAINQGSTWAAELRIEEGFPYMALFGEDFQRNDQGRVIVGDDGFPLTTGTREYLGSAIADFTGGVRNTFRWKGLSLSGLIDFQSGGVIHSTSLQWAQYSGMTENTVFQNGVDIRAEGMVIDGVTEEGNENTVAISPQNYYQGYWFVATPNVYSGDFIKLREIKLSYALPSSLISKTPFNEVTVGAFGRNLAIISADLPYLDPQVVTGSGNVQGLENAQVPSTRSIGFNLGFKF